MHKPFHFSINVAVTAQKKPFKNINEFYNRLDFNMYTALIYYFIPNYGYTLIHFMTFI